MQCIRLIGDQQFWLPWHIKGYQAMIMVSWLVDNDHRDFDQPTIAGHIRDTQITILIFVHIIHVVAW